MGKLKNNEQRGRILILFFWILLGATVVSGISNFMEYLLLSNLNAGLSVTEEQANFNDLRQRFIGFALIGIYIALAILFIMWFRRAYYNLEQVDDIQTTYTNGWAAGAWFVPIMNLFRPYQIMLEIWKKTQVVKEDLMGGSYKEPATIVGWWWATHIISSILTNFVNRMYADSTDFDLLMTADILLVFIDIIEIASIIVTVIMVRKTMQFERDFYEKHQEVDLTDNLIEDF